MRSYSQNPVQLQEELLNIIEDKSVRKLVEIAADTFRGLPYHSKTKKNMDEGIDAFIRKPEDSLLYKTRYPMPYWIGAYVLYIIPENRKMLEDYKRLNHEIKHKKEKLSQLEPEYIKVTNTNNYLKEVIKGFNKKINSIERQLNKRETMLNSLKDSVKRNKLIKEIENLQKERDELFEMYHDTVAEIEKITKRDIIKKYIETESEIEKMEHEKYVIELKVYKIIYEMP